MSETVKPKVLRDPCRAQCDCIVCGGEPGPSIETDDGYTIQVDQHGGFTLFDRAGRVFGWAQTPEEANMKVELERGRQPRKELEL